MGYLLGHSPKETRRLRQQAKLWDPVSYALFDRLGIKKGTRILEVGPGAGSLHRELRRRARGPVDAVEMSATYCQNLARIAAQDGFGAGRIWNCDLATANLPRSTYDVIFVRWVFLFLPKPAERVAQLARALKPGGRLAIQDYFRETFQMIPTPPEWRDFVRADQAFFAKTGGCASLAGQLPEFMTQAGLTVTDITPHTKWGHPGSDVWNWLSDYFLGVLNRYAKLAPFSNAKARRLTRFWKTAAKNRASILIGPTVVDVVSRKLTSSRGRRGSR